MQGIVMICNQETPWEVREGVQKGLLKRVVGVFMSHDTHQAQLDMVDKLLVCTEAMMVVPTLMRWTLSNKLRDVMCACRECLNHSTDGPEFQESLNKLEQSLERLRQFCETG
ncbi:MAG: hypothetical protein JSS66_06375 [Armatimonadetes bacterium]|nr:hypothetical protein [Armatimonadota bacterium]